MLLENDPISVEPIPNFIPDPFYYLTHFRRFLDEVQNCCAALLSTAEREYCAVVTALSQNALILYVRLTNRRGPMFRIARLDYLADEDMNAAIDELCRSGLLRHATTEDPLCDDLLRLFTVAELRSLFAPPVKTWRRDDICAWLLTRPEAHDCLLAQGGVIVLTDTCLDFLKFLYFGDLHGSLGDFVVRELGHINPELASGRAISPRFADGRASRDCFAMHRLYDDFRARRDTMPPQALYDWFVSQNLVREAIDETGHERYDRLIARLGRILERADLCDAALDTYRRSPCFAAAERGLRILLKRKDLAAARDWMQHAQLRDFTAGERHVWQELQARTGAKALPNSLLLLLRDNAETPIAWKENETVEDAALRHWAGMGWSGVHSENWLWHALFGLLLWDIVYAPDAPGFHNALQIAPDGLYRRGYFRPLTPAISARLRLLDRPDDCAAHFSAVFAAKRGKTNPFLSWHDDTLDVMGHVLRRVPAKGLRSIVLRMTRDLGAWGSGLPDLFLWTDSDYRFVEVKSPNDRIQPHQYQWIRAFRRAGLHCDIMRMRRL